jgi:hypothetical protein
MGADWGYHALLAKFLSDRGPTKGISKIPFWEGSNDICCYCLDKMFFFIKFNVSYKAAIVEMYSRHSCLL